jgi:hypothetical protein
MNASDYQQATRSEFGCYFANVRLEWFLVKADRIPASAKRF